ncbi:MAG: YcaO-like family protein [Eubacteriales bacterium]|nr:YcaO-like family protein [Eubacteriales bacterium]
MTAELKEKAERSSNVYADRSKDAAPEETVNRILACLDQAGLKTVYEECYSDVEGCCSSRVRLDSPAGDFFGTNGKGLTPAFTKASAYGELMERLQNIMFSVHLNWNDPESEQMILNGTDTVDLTSDALTGPGKRIIEKIESGLPAFLPVFQKSAIMRDLLSAFCPGKNSTQAQQIPFYSLREDRIMMIPEYLLYTFIKSNGLAAGNTLEEATVQAISEIFERKAAEYFLSGRGTPPEIPSCCVERYPEIQKIITGIEASGRYAVRLFDCSMGIGLPVVAGAVFDKENTKIGIKFGAHPHMRIALERIFTESMQGCTLEKFCRRGWISFSETEDNISLNTWNHIKIGYGFVHDRIFSQNPDYPFTEWPETESLSNKDLAREMLRKLDSMCDGVYIRDASFMGFPSVAVYAENYSEVFPASLTEAKVSRLARDVADIFSRGIDQATDKDVEMIERYIRVKNASLMENTFCGITGLYPALPLPGGTKAEVFLLRAACLYRLGRFQEAASILSRVSDAGLSADEDARFLSAAALYVNGIAAGRAKEHVERIIRLSVPEHTAEKVISAFSDRERILSALYPTCTSNCESCRAACLYPEIKRIFRLLYDMRKKYPVDQQNIAGLFRGTLDSK